MAGMQEGVRMVSKGDAAFLVEIYRPFVEETVISFEYDVPSVEEMEERIVRVREGGYPWLVGEREGQVVGYAYASQFNERTAYQWAVNVTVYVDSACHGTGLAQKLYASLFAILSERGFVQAYALIIVPNLKSENFHKRFGFTPVGLLPSIGFKFGQWHSVQWWLKSLCDLPQTPKSLTSE